MSIASIEKRNEHTAELITRLKHDVLEAKATGQKIDRSRIDSIRDGIEMEKLWNTFDILNLKHDRWVVPGGGDIDDSLVN